MTAIAIVITIGIHVANEIFLKIRNSTLFDFGDIQFIGVLKFIINAFHLKKYKCYLSWVIISILIQFSFKNKIRLSSPTSPLSILQIRVSINICVLDIYTVLKLFSTTYTKLNIVIYIYSMKNIVQSKRKVCEFIKIIL